MGINGNSVYPPPPYDAHEYYCHPRPGTNALSSLFQKSNEIKSRPGEIRYRQELYSQPDPSSSILSEQGPWGYQYVAFATTANSQPPSITPLSFQRSHLEELYPASPSGFVAQRGVASPYGPGSLMQPNSLLQDGEQPTHVIKSQDHRGILRSAPRRPAAKPARTGAKNIVVPVKDADGKLPCPQCTKTYLHAKYLKRHLRRHTGDRPYICVLCQDTFTRGDTLKRHFNKCSIRRSNSQVQQQSALGNSNQIEKIGGGTESTDFDRAQPAGTGAKNIIVPVKDADGRFPCSQCTKTYRHARHLKRHLRRHTDDRPYICVLCQDTFSRGDTLKRHFQKCAIRRGNPTGASHLSDPKAYLNNRPETQQEPAFGRSNQINKTGSGTESTGFDSFVARNMPAAENGVLTYPDFRPNEKPVFKWDMHSLIPPGSGPTHCYQQMPLGWQSNRFQSTPFDWYWEVGYWMRWAEENTKM